MRALLGAASLGSLIGLAMGGAYLAGGLAWTSVVHARITRLADAAHAGFSETALAEAAKDSPGALVIAKRFDPDSSAAQDVRDRRLEAWTARLEAKRGVFNTMPAPHTGTSPAKFQLASISAAQPFRLRDALDESRDLQCLSEAVYFEARGETPAGQEAVAQVVLNRVRHRAFPKTICGVVYQRAVTGGCQFSFACDGSIHHAFERGAWDRAQRVAARALDGRVMAAVGNATHYHSIEVRPDWGAQLERVAQIGAHIFYRFNGRVGSRAMFNGQALPSSADDMPDATNPNSAAQSASLASLAPTGPAPNAKAAGLFLASTAKVVENAAQAVENASHPAPAKPESGRTEEVKP